MWADSWFFLLNKRRVLMSGLGHIISHYLLADHPHSHFNCLYKLVSAPSVHKCISNRPPAFKVQLICRCDLYIFSKCKNRFDFPLIQCTIPSVGVLFYFINIYNGKPFESYVNVESNGSMWDLSPHVTFPYETGLMKQWLITDFPGNPIDTVDNVRRTEGTKYPCCSGNLLKWWMTALTTPPLIIQCRKDDKENLSQSYMCF